MRNSVLNTHSKMGVSHTVGTVKFSVIELVVASARTNLNIDRVDLPIHYN